MAQVASTGKWPIAKYAFIVRFSGIAEGKVSFQEVKGLEQEAEILEYRHGKMIASIPMKRAGMVRTRRISFRRGIFKGETFAVELFTSLFDDNVFGATHGKPIEQISVALVDEHFNEVMSWYIHKATPIRIMGTDLNAQSNEIAIEQIDFVHEGITVELHE